MTDIGEAVKIAGVTQEKPSCNPDNTDTSGWKAVIDGIKGGEGSASKLLDNMVAQGFDPPEYPSKKSGLADLFECSPNIFPCQTHHLIPEKFLPGHPVTAWLTDSPKNGCENEEFKLSGDTEYDTNGARNGYYMPFASTTYQWNNTANATLRKKICFEMMRLTKTQLHQGPHSKSKDYGEEEDVEEYSPYKKQVEIFLDEIDRQVTSHVKKCTDGCQKSGKENIPPLFSTVAMVEQVSHLLKVLLKRGEIVVSGRAGAYRNKYAKGGRYTHPTEPFVTQDDFN